jgi:hypothetical protein
VTDAAHSKRMGYVALACAAFVAGAALASHTVTGSRRLAVLIAAAVFALAGLQLVTSATGRRSQLLGGLACAGLAALGLFAAFTPDTVSGGLPFIPESWNQAAGHALFGFGALLTGAMAVYFFRRAATRG